MERPVLRSSTGTQDQSAILRGQLQQRIHHWQKHRDKTKDNCTIPSLNFSLSENFLIVKKIFSENTILVAKNPHSRKLIRTIKILSTHNPLHQKFAAVCKKCKKTSCPMFMPTFITTMPLTVYIKFALYTLYLKKTPVHIFFCIAMENV